MLVEPVNRGVLTDAVVCSSFFIMSPANHVHSTVLTLAVSVGSTHLMVVGCCILRTERSFCEISCLARSPNTSYELNSD